MKQKADNLIAQNKKQVMIILLKKLLKPELR